jgi:hypothetical protein
MPVDERARHQLFRKLEEVLGGEEAGTLMDHLPPAGFADLVTKDDLRLGLDSLDPRLTAQVEGLRAQMESLARRIIMWTSSMVLLAAALAFAAGRFA